jgi:hypothetical protein
VFPFNISAYHYIIRGYSFRFVSRSDLCDEVSRGFFPSDIKKRSLRQSIARILSERYQEAIFATKYREDSFRAISRSDLYNAASRTVCGSEEKSVFCIAALRAFIARDTSKQSTRSAGFGELYSRGF